jgi:hypothetical protein
VVMASRLPEAVYRLLPDVILRTPADAAAVAALWRAVCKVYPSEEAAAAAVVNTPSLILPWVNTPSNVAGSFAVLVDILDSTESAQDVISKNPGILACNPQRLALSSAGEIKAKHRERPRERTQSRSDRRDRLDAWSSDRSPSPAACKEPRSIRSCPSRWWWVHSRWSSR